MGATDAGIGVTGSGVLAHLVASILATDGREVARTGGEGPLLLARFREPRSLAPSSRLGTPSVWIELAVGLAETSEARQVIGLATPLRGVRLDWPNAESHSSADVGDVVRGGEHIVDLFYEDGVPELPAWLEPEPIARYLELVGAGDVFPGAVPEPLDLPPASLVGEPVLQSTFKRSRSAR